MMTIGGNKKLKAFKLRHFRFSAKAKEVTDYLTNAEFDNLEEFMISRYGILTTKEIDELFSTMKIIDEYDEKLAEDLELEIWRRQTNGSRTKYKVQMYRYLNG